MPVLPEDDTLSDHMIASSLKRKWPGCDTPLAVNKKARVAAEDGLYVESPETLDPSEWDSDTINPSRLTGPKAEMWRQLVIQHMFPGKPRTVSKEVSLSGSSADTTTSTSRPGPSGYAKDVATMAQFNKRLPRITREPYALSYILLGAHGRGKFDAVKATALGLKGGPARGRLAKGETVVTPEGKTITPDMVLGTPPKPDVGCFLSTSKHLHC